MNSYTALMILHQMNGKPFNFYSTFYTNSDTNSNSSKETLVLRSTLCDVRNSSILSPGNGKLEAIVEIDTNNVYFLYIPNPVRGEQWNDCLINPQDVIQIFMEYALGTLSIEE